MVGHVGRYPVLCESNFKVKKLRHSRRRLKCRTAWGDQRYKVCNEHSMGYLGFRHVGQDTPTFLTLPSKPPGHVPVPSLEGLRKLGASVQELDP